MSLVLVLVAVRAEGLEPGEPNASNALATTQALSPTEAVPFGAIDLLGGGLELAIPLFGAPVSDRLSLDLAARYDSKAQWQISPWYVHPGTWGTPYGLMTQTCTPDDWRDNYRIAPPSRPCAGNPDGRPDHGWTTELGWGWRFTLGRIAQFHGHSVYLPDGSSHKLYKLGANDAAGSGQQLISRDGSRLRASWSYNVPAVYGDDERLRNRIYKVFAPNGVIYEYGHYVSAEGDCGDHDDKVDDYHRNGWYVTSISDQFGNRIDVEYHEGPFVQHIIRRIKDTHGRVIETELTENTNPILAGLIQAITYPTTTGMATIEFTYGDAPGDIILPSSGYQTACGPPVPQRFTDMQVALLEKITLPEGVTHSFSYNQYGEVLRHVLPAGGVTTYEFSEFTWLDRSPDLIIVDCTGINQYWYPPDEYIEYPTYRSRFYRSSVQGRGVSTRTVAESAGASPARWNYYRNQVWGLGGPYLAEPVRIAGSGYGHDIEGMDFHVSVQDPFDMWRTLTFLPDAVNSCVLPSNVVYPHTGLLHHVYVWDRPMAQPWPQIESGRPPPSPVYARLHLENKWEVDDWSAPNADYALVDRNARISWSRLIQPNSVDTTSRCDWDGLGHFEYEVVRSWPFADFGTQVTRQVHAPLVCQWILDLPVLEQVAKIESGVSPTAATVERRYTVDGQLLREVQRSDFDPFTPPTCDNESAPIVTESPRGKQVERALRDAPGNWVDQTSLMGPWRVEEHHAGQEDGYVWCDGRRITFRVQDHDQAGAALPSPAPPAGCSPSPAFTPPSAAIERRPGSGDVQVDYSYFASSGEPESVDSHGHPSWGQLRTTLTSGGDAYDHDGDTVAEEPTKAYVKHHEWACGTHETETFSGIWYLFALDQDIQCDVPGSVTGPQTGLVLKSRTPGGFATTYEYDDLWRLTRTVPDVTDPPPPHGGAAQEAPTSITYSADQRQVSVIKRAAGALPEEGIETYTTFDGLGRQVLTQMRRDASVLSTKATSFDELGRVTRTSRWFDTSTPHDLQQGPTGSLLLYGDATSRDPFGRPLEIQFADDLWPVQFIYIGRTTIEIVRGINGSPLPSATAWTMNARGQLRNVGTPTSTADAYYAYDVLGNITTARLASGSEAQTRKWTFDALGRLRTSSTPESGATSGYVYDALGNVLAYKDSDGRSHCLEYDGAGRLGAIGQPVGSVCVPTNSYHYDYPLSTYCKGRLVYTIAYNGAGPQVHEWRDYDGLSGRMSSVRHTRSSPSEGGVFFDRQEHYTHDALGGIVTASYPRASPEDASQLVVAYSHEYGNPVAVGTPMDPDCFVESVTYSPAGRPVEMQLGNGMVETTSVDIRGRVSRMEVTGSTPGVQVFDSGTYQYDGASNVMSIGATATRGSDHFTYDDSSRLLTAELSDVGTYATSFDAFGNMTSQALTATSGCAPFELNEFQGREFRMGQDNTPVGEVTNRISVLGVDPSCYPGASIAHANTGAVLMDETARYTFDLNDRMTSRTPFSTGQRSEFLYNAQSQRVSIDVLPGLPGGRTEYVWGQDGQILSVEPDANTRVHHVHLGGRVVATRTVTSGQPPVDRWFHSDHLGSTRAITLGSGAVESRHDFGPWGIELPRTGPSTSGARMFSGHLREGDDSHDYMIGRFMSVRQGRFLTVDPASPDPANPATWNAYTYALNNPLVNIDPDGRQSKKGHWTRLKEAYGQTKDGAESGIRDRMLEGHRTGDPEMILGRTIEQRAADLVAEGIVEGAEFALERATTGAAGSIGRKVSAYARALLGPRKKMSQAELAARGGARFGQRGVSRKFGHGEFAGRTIDDVAAGLRSGAISPSQLPVHTITRDGVTYVMNNRSLMTLRQAGMEPTEIWDVTGNAYFERYLTERLEELGGEVGSDFVPYIRKGKR